MSELTEASPAERHRRLAADFLATADAVTDWDAPTPVTEWRARDVVEHLGWLPGMLAGMGVALDVPGRDGAVERLRAQSERVQEILDGPAGARVVDTNMFGELPLAQVIDQFYTFDLYAHRWDLARSSGQTVELDADYAQAALTGMSAMGPALHASGQFGTPQPVADDAAAADRLMAFLGRDPHWMPDG